MSSTALKRVGVTVAFGALSAILATGQTQLARANPQLDELLKAPAHRVVLTLAVSGTSAGAVLRLPDHLIDALQHARARTDTFPGDRTAFSVLIERDAAEPLISLGSAVNPEQVLRGFAARRSLEDWEVRNPGRFGVFDIAAGGASICRAALQAKLRTSHQGASLLQLVSAAVGDATGTAVPSGFVGSCSGASQFPRPAEYVEAGITLEAALNDIVYLFPGTAWIAVETADRQCSLGVVERRHDGNGVCETAIADNIVRKSR